MSLSQRESNVAALHNILTRSACASLVEPAPNKTELESIFQAALRAPDHARLRPWRFVTISGDALQQFSQLFLQYAIEKQLALSTTAREKVLAKGQRAPLVIVVIARLQQHPKVPEIEQYLSAGAAAQNILLAAHALNYQGIWRTGELAFSQLAAKAFCLDANETIVGFLYLGTARSAPKPLPAMNTADFVGAWSGF